MKIEVRIQESGVRIISGTEGKNIQRYFFVITVFIAAEIYQLSSFKKRNLKNFVPLPLRFSCKHGYRKRVKRNGD
jgi:membrane protein involved in colicin uptake